MVGDLCACFALHPARGRATSKTTSLEIVYFEASCPYFGSNYDVGNDCSIVVVLSWERTTFFANIKRRWMKRYVFLKHKRTFSCRCVNLHLLPLPTIWRLFATKESKKFNRGPYKPKSKSKFDPRRLQRCLETYIRRYLGGDCVHVDVCCEGGVVVVVTTQKFVAATTVAVSREQQSGFENFCLNERMLQES